MHDRDCKDCQPGNPCKKHSPHHEPYRHIYDHEDFYNDGSHPDNDR